MQLKQKYTINNITFENEMFISEKDNVNIIGAIEYFFNIPNICKKLEVVSICEKDEQPAKQVVGNTIVTVPAEHKEKETDVNVNIEKKETDEKDIPGFYIKFTIGENEIEKWKAWKSKAAARQFLSDLVYRRKREVGYEVKYSLIELKPMTKQEFDNRNNK